MEAIRKKVRHWAWHVYRALPLLLTGVPLWVGLIYGVQAELAAPLDTVFLKALFVVSPILLVHVVRQWLLDVTISWDGPLTNGGFFVAVVTAAGILGFAFGA